MSRLRDLPLIVASVGTEATFGEAVTALFASRSPALAVLDADGHPVGIVAEADVLRAVFPGYLSEVRHTSFLQDDAAALDELFAKVRLQPIGAFARPVETLPADSSESHAAERFIHTQEPALPVVDGRRFLGMLSIAALCRARVDRTAEA
jgi:CBS domain-containing protein